MKLFLRKVAFRIVLLCALVYVVFNIEWKKDYYFNIPKYSDHFKITWFNNKISKGELNENSILFFGSSICQYSIHDSLLNEIDSSNLNYFNCGVNHPCHALTCELLKLLLETHHVKPDKVFLCLKENAINSGIHSMYGAVADKGDILHSVEDGNMFFASDLFKHTAWNMNRFSGIFKWPELDSTQNDQAKYGFVARRNFHHTMSLESLNKDSMEVSAILKLMDADIAHHAIGSGVAWHKKFSMRWIENVRFQDNMFYACAQLLEKHQVPFEIVLYPEFSVMNLNKQTIVTDYYKLRYHNINFDAHPVRVVEDENLKSLDCWSDLNHLNEKGAKIFTEALFQQIKN